MINVPSPLGIFSNVPRGSVKAEEEELGITRFIRLSRQPYGVLFIN